jgi:hypothetical protein
VDASRFNATVQRIQALRPSAIVMGHGPAITGAKINEAFGLMRQVPVMEPVPFPTQAELDAMLGIPAAAA